MTEGPCKGSFKQQRQGPAVMKANPFSPSMSRRTTINVCTAAHKDYPATRLTPGQTCSISVLTTVFTGSWLPNQYCRLRYTTPQLGHSITYLQKRKTGYLSEILEVQCTSALILAAVLTLTRHTWQGPAKGSQWKQRFLAPR